MQARPATRRGQVGPRPPPTGAHLGPAVQQAFLHHCPQDLPLHRRLRRRARLRGAAAGNGGSAGLLAFHLHGRRRLLLLLLLLAGWRAGRLCRHLLPLLLLLAPGGQRAEGRVQDV